MHQSAEENNREDTCIYACCFNCRDKSLWGRIFYDFIQRFMKFAVQCRFPCKLMSCRRFLYNKIRGLMFWLIVLKCKWPASFQYLIFHFVSFCHSWKTALCCLYFTLRFYLTRLKTFIRWQVNFLKKEYTLSNYHYLISYYMLNIKTYIHVIYITTIPRFHKSHFLKTIFW